MSKISFVVQACDGIYDCVSNEELTKWFKVALDQYKNKTFNYTPRSNDPKAKIEPVKDIKLEHLVQKFLDEICAVDTLGGKGTDNMTCILIVFN